MYYDAFTTPTNVFRRLIQANYNEYYDLFCDNDRKTVGIKNQYAYPTRDYVDTLRFLGRAPVPRPWRRCKDIPRKSVENHVTLRKFNVSDIFASQNYILEMSVQYRFRHIFVQIFRRCGPCYGRGP